jgi:hypothetical protein
LAKLIRDRIDRRSSTSTIAFACDELSTDVPAASRSGLSPLSRLP